MNIEIAFVKGHGTENDFVVIPDANGRMELTKEHVVALCDRRTGVGGDGVIRVVRTDATDDEAAVSARGDATWFMDYRNSDGSLSEMCGNGIRVMGQYLATHADIDKREQLAIATRAGIKTLTFAPGGITVDMGTPNVMHPTWIEVGGRRWDATSVDMGNPHAVVFVDSFEDLGPLTVPPTYDSATYPQGTNVEFVRRGDRVRQLVMRVYERGVGVTRSCGTGACAVMAVAALADDAPRDVAYSVELPGGALSITWTSDNRILMTGPSVLVAEGVATL